MVNFPSLISRFHDPLNPLNSHNQGSIAATLNQDIFGDLPISTDIRVAEKVTKEGA